MSESNLKPVLVTTSHRGVFFGYLPNDADRAGGVLHLQNARCAIRFGTSGGFLELASRGPTSRSKVGARAPGVVTLQGVTSVSDVSEDAAAAWEAA